jgi:3-isopropylmalate/(R)-2-methylmalate dehydratase small subunit
MMEIFTQHCGVMLPIEQSNIDTDALLPKQYLGSINKFGYGNWLFDDVRYLDKGTLETDCSQRRINPEFILNQPEFSDASIVLARENFGCGSSREHAVWALRDYGIKVIFAQSFASIFFENCFKNNILCVELDNETLEVLFKQCNSKPGSKILVKLEEQQIVLANSSVLNFSISLAHKEKLLFGLDDIAVTLKEKEAILRYEAQSQKQSPWLFNSFNGQS